MQEKIDACLFLQQEDEESSLEKVRDVVNQIIKVPITRRRRIAIL